MTTLLLTFISNKDGRTAAFELHESGNVTFTVKRPSNPFGDLVLFTFSYTSYVEFFGTFLKQKKSSHHEEGERDELNLSFETLPNIPRFVMTVKTTGASDINETFYLSSNSKTNIMSAQARMLVQSSVKHTVQVHDKQLSVYPI